jgi:hypothetical protein
MQPDSSRGIESPQFPDFMAGGPSEKKDSTMPLQNRVTPFGDIVAVPNRGLFMGNRGCLIHRDGRSKALPWGNRHWIICRTAYKGRRLPLREPGRNTQLFFLDEAAALAAGHRPCFFCRRDDSVRFCDAWLRGNSEAGLTDAVRIDAIDNLLHTERVRSDGTKVTYRSRLKDLPTGVIVSLDGEPEAAFLIVASTLWRWTPGGYAVPRAIDAAVEATVLTPRSTVHAIVAGYVSVLHTSAFRQRP